MQEHYFAAYVLIGASCLSVLFSFTIIYMLIVEVRRAYRASGREQVKLILYLDRSRDIFNEHYEMGQRDGNGSRDGA